MSLRAPNDHWAHKATDRFYELYRPRVSDAELARAVAIAIDPDAPVEKLRLLLQLVVELKGE